jgi:murein DD-endopeptidase MepM/ murein hydrolase activator NlpD
MGHYVIIKTPYGTVRMQHMKYRHVVVGQEVCPGTLVGVCGTTGSSTGIHLHIAYRTLLNVSISPEQFFSMYGEFYLYNGKFPVGTVSRTRGSFLDKKHWQEFLCWYGPNTTVDGDFGTDTEKWTMEFQRLNGLTPDGVVGPLTRAKAKTVRK